MTAPEVGDTGPNPVSSALFKRAHLITKPENKMTEEQEKRIYLKSYFPELVPETETEHLFFKYLSERTFWEEFWFKTKLWLDIMWYELHSDEYRLEVWTLRHLFLFKLYGYKPLTMGTYFEEDTFIFETSEEAEKAGKFFEPEERVKFRPTMCGWWYGKKEFEEELREQHEKCVDDGNIIGGEGSDLGSIFFRGVSFNFVKLWEKENGK